MDELHLAVVRTHRRQPSRHGVAAAGHDTVDVRRLGPDQQRLADLLRREVLGREAARPIATDE